MAQVVGFELNVNGGNAEKSILAIKKELQNANKEIQTAAEEFGIYSQQVIDAETKVSTLKNQLQKATSESRKLTSIDKLAAFNSTLNTVAGGFSAVIGAQALLGAESEDVQKQLAKVQAAMSFAQGIESITAASGGFKKLAAVIKTNVVGAFSSMKAAIASTGIGLLIIGIGLLVEKFMSMSDAAEEAAKSQEKLNESTKKFADIGLKANLAALEREEKLLISRARLAGKSEDEIFTIQQDYRKKKLEVQTGYYNEIKNVDANAAADALNNIKNGIVEGQVAELDNQTKLKKIRSDAAIERSQKNKENADKQKKETQQANDEQNKLQKQLQDEITLSLISNERDRAATKLEMDLENAKKDIENGKATTKEKNESIALLEQQYMVNLRAMQDKWAEEDIAKIQENATKQAEKNNEKRKLDYENKQKELADQKAYNEAVLQAEQELQDAKFGIVEGGISALQTLAQGNEKLSNILFAVEKAAAIAKIVVNTQNEIAGYYANPTWSLMPDGGLALKTAASLKAKIRAGISIGTILATTIAKYKQGGGGNVPTPPISQIGMNAPLTPQVQTTNLNQGQINQLASATSRAFVLESDVSGSQERIQRLNRAARIN
jgi:hypothetical protein